MPVPFPSDEDVLLQPPDATEVAVLARGVAGAIAPGDGLTDLQRVLMHAVFESMTGFPVELGDVDPLGPEDFAQALARRNEIFRTRIVQVMLLGSLILVPLPEDVADRVDQYATALGVEEGMLRVAHRYARGRLGLAENGVDEGAEIRDTAGALQLGYDAARKTSAALLAVQGLRATTRGGHIAVLESVRDQFDGPGGVAVFGCTDRYRRRRHDSEYPDPASPGVTLEDAVAAIRHARELVTAAHQLLDSGRLDAFS